MHQVYSKLLKPLGFGEPIFIPTRDLKVGDVGRFDTTNNFARLFNVFELDDTQAARWNIQPFAVNEDDKRVSVEYMELHHAVHNAVISRVISGDFLADANGLAIARLAVRKGDSSKATAICIPTQPVTINRAVQMYELLYWWEKWRHNISLQFPRLPNLGPLFLVTATTTTQQCAICCDVTRAQETYIDVAASMLPPGAGVQLRAGALMRETSLSSMFGFRTSPFQQGLEPWVIFLNMHRVGLMGPLKFFKMIFVTVFHRLGKRDHRRTETRYRAKGGTGRMWESDTANSSKSTESRVVDESATIAMMRYDYNGGQEIVLPIKSENPDRYPISNNAPNATVAYSLQHPVDSTQETMKEGAGSISVQLKRSFRDATAVCLSESQERDNWYIVKTEDNDIYLEYTGHTLEVPSVPEKVEEFLWEQTATQIAVALRNNTVNGSLLGIDPKARLSSEEFMAWDRLGQIYTVLEDVDAVVQLYKELSVLDRSEPWVWTRLGNAYTARVSSLRRSPLAFSDAVPDIAPDVKQEIVVEDLARALEAHKTALKGHEARSVPSEAIYISKWGEILVSFPNWSSYVPSADILDGSIPNRHVIGDVETKAQLQSNVLTAQSHLKRDHHDVLSCMHGIAVTYFLQNRMSEAIILQDELVEVRTRKLGQWDPLVLITKHNLAMMYWAVERMIDASNIQNEVLASATTGPLATDETIIGIIQKFAKLYQSQLFGLTSRGAPYLSTSQDPAGRQFQPSPPPPPPSPPPPPPPLVPHRPRSPILRPPYESSPFAAQTELSDGGGQPIAVRHRQVREVERRGPHGVKVVDRTEVIEERFIRTGTEDVKFVPPGDETPVPTNWKMIIFVVAVIAIFLWFKR